MRPVPILSRRRLYIPLSVAAAIVYRAFLGPDDERPRTEAELEKHVDEAAHAVSIALPIYRLDLADPVALDAATLAEGAFVDGGRALHFRDGRPPIEPLGVNRAQLDHALAKRAYALPA